MGTSDLIALGSLAVATAGVLGAATAFVYRAARERRRVTVTASFYRSDGPFFITALKFPSARSPASISRVGFAVSIIITNGSATPLVVSSVGLEDSSGSVDPSVGGAFRHLARAGDTLELSEPIHFPHQIPAHDALALAGVFEVTIPSDMGVPLFQLYCSEFSEQKMKDFISDLQSHVTSTVDFSPMGLKLVELKVPEMEMRDGLVRQDGDRTRAKSKFGVIPLGASLAVLAHCQKHGLAWPVQSVPTSTRLVVKFALRKPVFHTFNHSADPMWFMFSRND